MSRRRGEAGFTLIELLIALTLVGLLTTLVFGGVRLAARAWGRTDDRAADAADQWAVANVLRDAIIAAYPAFASADLHDRTIAFDGEAGSLALLAPLPQAIAAGVPAQLRFYVAGDGRARALVLGWRLDLPSAETGDPLPENHVVLLDRVHRIGFAYFGADEPDEAPAWHERWAEATTLPQLVRVHIERGDRSLPAWPDLIASPRAMINTACVFDPLTAGCRRLR
ncbi:MAG TPA: prepilin-type N-terminal cleavage/methylation domain-containing protein [Stellaceae bacterium]|jgi:general secretion pathway protein J